MTTVRAFWKDGYREKACASTSSFVSFPRSPTEIRKSSSGQSAKKRVRKKKARPKRRQKGATKKARPKRRDQKGARNKGRDKKGAQFRRGVIFRDSPTKIRKSSSGQSANV